MVSDFKSKYCTYNSTTKTEGKRPTCVAFMFPICTAHTFMEENGICSLAFFQKALPGSLAVVLPSVPSHGCRKNLLISLNNEAVLGPHLSGCIPVGYDIYIMLP